MTEAANPTAIAGVPCRRCALKEYCPRACPMRPTPAADPIDSRLPPTPAVKVTRSHCGTADICGGVNPTETPS